MVGICFHVGLSDPLKKSVALCVQRFSFCAYAMLIPVHGGSHCPCGIPAALA